MSQNFLKRDPNSKSTSDYGIYKENCEKYKNEKDKDEKDNDDAEKPWQCRRRPDWFRWNGTFPACSWLLGLSCPILLSYSELSYPATPWSFYTPYPLYLYSIPPLAQSELSYPG